MEPVGATLVAKSNQKRLHRPGWSVPGKPLRPINTQGINMLTWFSKHIAIISLLLIVVLITVSFLSPSTAGILGIIILLLGLVLTSITLIRRHRQAYLQGQISRTVYFRNVILEMAGVLLAMVLAAWVGNRIALFATRQIDHTLTRFLAIILVGLLIGVIVGTLVKKTWNSFLKIPQIK